MNRYHTLSLLLIALLSGACSNGTYYKTKTGLLYRIVSSSGKDSIARMGNTVKIHYIQKVGDTIIESTYGKMPLYYMVLPGISPYNPLEPFDYGLTAGDSVETIQVIDSMVKKGILKTMKPWMKKDDQWITTFKVEKVFRSDSLLQIDKQEETVKVTEFQKAAGAKRIEAYLKEHHIKAAGNTQLVYNETVKPGTGRVADSGKYVSMDINVKTLQGKLINSTTDTGFHQKGPAQFIVGTGFFPPMVEEQVKHMQNGGVLRMYIPGVLIFGLTPQSPAVKTDDDIIFELELRDVQDKKTP